MSTSPLLPLVQDSLIRSLSWGIKPEIDFRTLPVFYVPAFYFQLAAIKPTFVNFQSPIRVYNICIRRTNENSQFFVVFFSLGLRIKKHSIFKAFSILFSNFYLCLLKPTRCDGIIRVFECNIQPHIST